MAELSAQDLAEAKKALQAFIDAGLRHDEPAMRALVTRRTNETGRLDPSAAPDGLRFVLDEPRLEGGRVIIPLKAYPEGAPEGAPTVMEMTCIMVQEDGQWKFDLATTMEGIAAGLEGAMEQMAKSMGEAMEGIGKAMAEGLQEAFNGATSAAPAEEPPADNPPPANAEEELAAKHPPTSAKRKKRRS